MLPPNAIEIERCVYGLFREIDAWRHDRLATFFTDTAAFNVAMSRADREAGRFAEVRGANDIADFLRRTFSSLAQTHHFISNLSVTTDGEGALVDMHMRAHHLGAGKVSHLFQESLAVVRTYLRREGDAVKINRFDYTVLISLGSMDVFAEA